MKKLLPILILSALILPNLAFGAVISIDNPLKYNKFEDLINAIIDFIFEIGIIITPLIIIIAAFIFLTAGGDPRKITQAKEMLLYTFIGLAVIILAKGLVLVLKSFFGIP